jgi:hypothetical protein
MLKTRCLEPHFSQAELKARRDPESLSDQERHNLVAFLTMFLNHYQNTFYQVRVGTLEKEQAGALDYLPILKAVPYYRQLWNESLPKQSYNKDFIAHVNSVLNGDDT